MLSKALRVELRRFCLWDQPQLWIGGYAGWRMPESYGGNPSAFSRTNEKLGFRLGLFQIAEAYCFVGFSHGICRVPERSLNSQAIVRIVYTI